MVECEVCHKLFPRKSNLSKHYLTHVTEKRFACDFCPKRFSRGYALRRHLRGHTGEQPFACDVCQRRFGYKCALAKHYSRAHGGGEKTPSSCEEKKFIQVGDPNKPILSQEGDLNKHILSQEGDLNKHVLSQEGDLNKHVVPQHEEKPFQCKTCQEKFSLGSLLESHMLIHSGAARPVPCDVCGMGYSHKRSCRKRQRSNRGRRGKTLCREEADPESRQKTHSGYEGSSSLGDSPGQSILPSVEALEGEIDRNNRDLRTHPSEESRSLDCEFCGKGTTDTQRHHLDETAGMPEHSRCPVCKKAFSRMRYLPSHTQAKKPGEAVAVADETPVLYKSVKNYGKKRTVSPQTFIKTEEVL